MLQQILKDMYIDPDVLEALNEDQKKTLFLKMRQEQVRRWTEREEKVEADGKSSESLRAKPKTGNGKNVSWHLGRDGDVAIMVIGEVDELRSSRLISSGLGERKSSGLHANACHQTGALKSNLVKTAASEPGRAGRENHPPKTQTGIQLNLKGNTEEVTRSPPLLVSASEQPPSPAVDKQVESTQASESASPEDEGRSSTTYYRPHIRVVPAAQRLYTISSLASTPAPAPAPAPVPAPAPAPAPASAPAPDPALSPSLNSSPVSSPPASEFSPSLTSPTSLTSLASAPVPSLAPSLSSAPALALARSLAPSQALERALASASASASFQTPATTPPLTPPSTSAPALSRFSVPISSSTASKSNPSLSLNPTPSQPNSCVTARLHPPEPQEPIAQESQASRDIRVVAASRRAMSEEAGSEGGTVSACAGRGRVAQLMKTFSVVGPAPPALTPPPRGSKPPLPTKPSHLRLTTSPSLR